MIMKKTTVFLLALFSLQLAIAKPTIDFRFRIEEPLLSLVFFNDLQMIENEVAARLLPYLNEYLCFASFQTDSHLENRFTVTLHNASQSGNRTIPQDVLFFFDLQGANVKPHEAAESWLFIDKTAYSLSQGDPETFISKVVATFAGKLRYDYHSLVEKYFCNLVISNQALFRREASEWALPLKRGEVGIDNGSLFEIVNEAQDNAGVLECAYKAVMVGYFSGSGLPADYRMGIRVRNSDNQDLCGIFSNPSLNVHVKEVLLKSFKRTLPAPADPVNYVPTENEPAP